MYNICHLFGQLVLCMYKTSAHIVSRSPRMHASCMCMSCDCYTVMYKVWACVWKERGERKNECMYRSYLFAGLIDLMCAHVGGWSLLDGTKSTFDINGVPFMKNKMKASPALFSLAVVVDDKNSSVYSLEVQQRERGGGSGGVCALVPGPSVDHQWTTSGPSVDHQWTTSGPPVDHQWTISGPPVDHQWTTSGPPVDHQWTISGPSVDHQWTISGPSVDYQWTTSGPPVDHQWTTSGPPVGPSVDHQWTTDHHCIAITFALYFPTC